MKKTILFVFAAFMLLCVNVQAQDKVVKQVIEMGTNDNRTMQHIDFLSNRIGGRLIGSYALTQAEEWVKDQFESWGLEVMVQEVGSINVGFNRGPWFGRMLSEDGMQLHFVTPSYTAGTKGPQVGHVVIEPRTRQEFEKMKGLLKGAWVLLDSPSNGFAINPTAQADSTRAAAIAKNEAIAKENAEIARYNREHPDSPKKMKQPSKTPALFYREMCEAGVLGFIQPADIPLTCLYDRANCYNLTMETLPTVCDIKLDKHQYEIIKQKVLEFQDFYLEFDIRNHFSKGPVKYHNIIGIIRGSKYPDETVLLGGHLDAYDAGTGAVDDAQGLSVAMEAARLLAAAGAKPKRTMMFCIWTGEEYGLLGSKFFCENKTVNMDKIVNYFNRDGGPTMATSITVPPAMYDDYVKVCKPVENYVENVGFKVIKREGKPRSHKVRAGGSDHAYFVLAGAPAIGFNCTDPYGYNFKYGEIWHTERDRYNRVFPEYLEPTSVISAVVAYGLANLDHSLSREDLYSD